MYILYTRSVQAVLHYDLRIVCDKMKCNSLHCYHVVSTRARARYPRTHEDFQLHQFPSRVQLLLEFEKMFTRVSRKGIRSILSQRPPHLLNLHDLNSGHVTRSYFRTPDGVWQYTEQEEGLVQGCPLSPPISSLVLARIVAIIQEELDVRDAERKRTGDFSNCGSGSRS